jgi:hypothetical protein
MVSRLMQWAVAVGLACAVIGCNGDATSPEPVAESPLPGWYRAPGPGDTLSHTEHYHGYHGFFPNGTYAYLELGFNYLKPADSTLFQATCLQGSWKVTADGISIQVSRKAVARRNRGLERDWQKDLAFSDTAGGPEAARPYRLSGDTLFLGSDSAGRPGVFLKTDLPAGVRYHALGVLSVSAFSPLTCGLGDTLRLRASVIGNTMGAEFSWRLPGENAYRVSDSSGFPWVAPRLPGTYTAWFRVKDGYGQWDSDFVSIRVSPRLSGILEDTKVTVDLDKVFDGDTASLPHTYAILDSSQGAALALDGNRLGIAPQLDFDGSLAIILKASGGDGSVLVDTLRVIYVPVNDPPRLVQTIADTSISYFDSLVYDLNPRFYDPEKQAVQFDLWLDSRKIGAIAGGHLALGAMMPYAGIAPGPVKVRITSSDGIAFGDSLVFNLNTNAPMQSGKSYPMPVDLFDGETPTNRVFLERNGQKLAMLLASPFLFLDGEGRYSASVVLPGEFDQEWGFRDSTVFTYQASSAVADSMRWITFTDNGPVRRAFGFEAGGTQWGADVEYVPVERSGASDFLFIRKSRLDLYGGRNAYSLEKWSGGTLAPVKDLGLPETLVALKVRAFGRGFVCFWRTQIDSMMSVDVSARYFSSEGDPLSDVLPLSSYSPGSLPGYGRNLTRMTEAVVFNGNLEVYTTTANLLVKTTAQQTIGDIDHAAFRTVISPAFAVLSKQTLPADAFLGAYASMERLNWNPLGATRYRLDWTALGYAGFVGSLAGITVDASGNTFSEGAKADAGTGTVDFSFAGGTILRFTNGLHAGSARLIR